MKILCACEESQRVCQAFRDRGHESYSCDIIPTSGDHPEWHIIDDVRNHMEGWDMICAFPPCTDITYASISSFPQKIADGRQQAGIDFFMLFVNADCQKIAIENPVGVMSNFYRKPDQIIHPWMFGDPFSKRTCLWLKGLPILLPTANYPRGEMIRYSKGHRHSKWYEDAKKHGKSMGKIRSRTFPGIAREMANQWG